MPGRADLPPDSESDDDLPLSVRKKRPAVGKENQASPAKRICLEKAARRDRPETGPVSGHVTLPDEVRYSLATKTGEIIHTFIFCNADYFYQSSISRMCVQVWLSIMHRLATRPLLALGSTCQRLLHLARDPGLWRGLSLDWQAVKRQEASKVKSVDLAVRRATRLDSLTLKNRTFEQIKSGAMMAVARRASSSLTSLTFSPEVVLSNSAVAQVTQLPPSLHTVGR